MTILTSLWGWLNDEWSAPPAASCQSKAEASQPSGALRADIDEAWGAEVLRRFPSVRVSSTSPYLGAVGVIAAAVNFWGSLHTGSLRYCEGGLGPSASPADIARGPDAECLVELETPLARALSSDLDEIQARSLPIDTWQESASGIRFQVVLGAPPRTGLGELLTAVSEHRRKWTEHHWTRLLEVIWERDRDAALAAPAMLGPTRRKTADVLAPVATRWFAGDLQALGQHLELPAPLTAAHPRAPRRIPLDPRLLQEAVLLRLSGPDDAPHSGQSPRRPSNRRYEIAEMAAEVLQLWEAKGRPPSCDEHGSSAYRAAEAMGLRDREAAFARYLEVLSDAAMSLGYGQPPETTPPVKRGARKALSVRAPVPPVAADGALARKAERVALAECDTFFYRMIVIGARVRGHPSWSRKRFVQVAAEAAAAELEVGRMNRNRVVSAPENVRAARAAQRALAVAAAEYFQREDIPFEAVREVVGAEVFDSFARGLGGPEAAARVITHCLTPEVWRRALNAEVHSSGKDALIARVGAVLTGALPSTS